MANPQQPIDDGLEDIFGDGDSNEGVTLNQESAPSFSPAPTPAPAPLQTPTPPVQEFQLPDMEGFDINGGEETGSSPVQDMIIETLPQDVQQDISVETKQPTMQTMRTSRKGMGRGLKVVLIVFISLIVLTVILVAVYALFIAKPETTETTQVEDIVQETPPVQDTVTNDANDIVEDDSQDDVVAEADSDGDGLLDSEEAEYGTSPQKIDTDSDGISDRTEIRVYKTDPLKQDTDGDGFTDGAEVRNFYNPNGEGKLPGIQEAIDQLSETE